MDPSRVLLSNTVFKLWGGQKWPRPKFWNFFIFHPILMGFFSLNCSQWELSGILQRIFSISYRFRDTRGPKGQKSDFWSHVKVLFFIQFRWDFFHWISLIKSFQNCSVDFFYLLPFSRYKGPKRAKMRFWKPRQSFIFHPILMGLRTF